MLLKGGNRDQATVSWENEKMGTNRNLNLSPISKLISNALFCSHSFHFSVPRPFSVLVTSERKLDLVRLFTIGFLVLIHKISF